MKSKISQTHEKTSVFNIYQTKQEWPFLEKRSKKSDGLTFVFDTPSPCWCETEPNVKANFTFSIWTRFTKM